MNFFCGKVFWIGLLIGLFFVLAESALRVRAARRFGEVKSTMIRDDPVEGRSLQPHFVSQGELRTITINEQGFRGKSFSQEPIPRTVRIAFLGSSNVFCGGTNSDHQTLPAVLEQVLNNELGPNQVEVINAGIPGMSTSMMQNHFERRVAPLKPKIAIISIPANDITPFMRGGVGPKRHFLATWRLKNSVLYNAGRDAVTVYTPGSDAGKYKRLPNDCATSLEESYIQLIRSCKEQGVQPVLMPLVSLLRADLSVEEQQRQFTGDFFGLGLPGALAAIDLLDSCAQKVAEEEQIPFLDVSNSVPNKKEYFEDLIHLNPAGNEILAKAIAQQLIATGVLE
ncbi:MAG: SGNH/GDSL hydrolase family protein [Thermoguttaceae bacterium]